MSRIARSRKFRSREEWKPFFIRPRSGCVEVQRILAGGQPPIRVFLNHASGDYSCLIPGRRCYERLESPSLSGLTAYVRESLSRRSRH